MVAGNNARQVLYGSTPGLAIAVLYRYWLITPILQYMSFRQWRFVAILVAAVIGVFLSVLRVPLMGSIGASLAGLLFGGAWTAWWAPSEVRVSFVHAFASHLQSFWGDVIVLTVAVGAGGLSLQLVRMLRRHG